MTQPAPEGRTPAPRTAFDIITTAWREAWRVNSLEAFITDLHRNGYEIRPIEAAAGVRVAEPEHEREHWPHTDGSGRWCSVCETAQPQPESGSAGTSGALRPWLERIVAASPGNGESATEYIGRLKGIALAALAEYARNEGSDAEPAAMSLLDRDTYNRLAGGAEPDGGGDR